VIRTPQNIKKIQKELGKWKAYYNQELSKVKTLQAACAEKDARITELDDRIADLEQKLANLETLIDKFEKEGTKITGKPEPWRRGVRQ